MALAIRTAIESIPRKFARWFIRELRAIAPAAIFFLIGFAIILLIIKLFLEQYSIEIRVLSNAVLGALIAAKVSLILDKLRLGRRGRSPRILIVAFHTAFYCCGVIVLGMLEKLVEGLRVTGSLAASARLVAANFDPDRFFAIVLLVSLVFALYFTLREIKEGMGGDELYALFFRRPPSGSEPDAAIR